jgi:hypothetical protein
MIRRKYQSCKCAYHVRKVKFGPVASGCEHVGSYSETEEFDSIDALVQTRRSNFEEFPGLRLKGDIVLLVLFIADELVNEDAEGDGNSNEEGEGQAKKDPNRAPVTCLQNGFSRCTLGSRLILFVRIDVSFVG